MRAGDFGGGGFRTVARQSTSCRELGVAVVLSCYSP